MGGTGLNTPPKGPSEALGVLSPTRRGLRPRVHPRLEGPLCWGTGGGLTCCPPQQGTAPPVQGFTDKTTFNCFSSDSHGSCPARLRPHAGNNTRIQPWLPEQERPRPVLVHVGDSSDELRGSCLGQTPQSSVSPTVCAKGGVQNHSRTMWPPQSHCCGRDEGSGEGSVPSQGSHQVAAGGSAIGIVHLVVLLSELHKDT